MSRRYTYGPVPSRRLGSSLGVSPIPHKTCSYSCIYCQLGRTNSLQIERESFYSKEDVFAEIEEQVKSSEFDFITFVGDGEPTLSRDLGWLISKCKENFTKPVAVITNGSLFCKPDVRRDLLKADIVLPSLDAGSEKLFRTVNRPYKSIDFDAMLKGEINFRHEYPGQIWLEVMLVRGINDTEEALFDIRDAIKKINPDRIYIVTPTRPPAESWVNPPFPEHIIRAQKILVQAETISYHEEGMFGLASYNDTSRALIGIGSRHPLRLEQAYEIEKRFGEKGIVESMLQEKRIVKTFFEEVEYIVPGDFIKDIN